MCLERSVWRHGRFMEDATSLGQWLLRKFQSLKFYRGRSVAANLLRGHSRA
jgi:hypothetical protein